MQRRLPVELNRQGTIERTALLDRVPIPAKLSLLFWSMQQQRPSQSVQQNQKILLQSRR